MPTIEATDRELQALAVLLDAAVKTLGIRGAGDAVLWIQKIEAALKSQTETPKENSNGSTPLETN